MTDDTTVIDNTNQTVQQTADDASKTANKLLDYVLDFFNVDGFAFLYSSWFQALIIFIVIIIFAYIVRYILQFFNKKIVTKIKLSIVNDIFSILYKPVFYSIILLGLVVVSAILDLGANIQSIFSKFIISAFWIMWGMHISKAAGIILRYFAYGAKEKNVIKVQTLPLFSNLSFAIVFIIFLYLVLSTWGVNMTALITSAGVMGIVIGFAAKDTLSNLISGVFILADQPYKIGDFVVLDSKERGEVTHIGIRSTRILTRDDVEITVPNAIMGNTKIINESGGPHKKYRIRVKVGVAYGTNVKIVRDALMMVANKTNSICNNPLPRVRFRTFGNSSLDFELLCWVDEPVLRGRILDSLNEEVYNEFLKIGIEIPYQKQDLYIKEIPQNN